MNLLDDIDLTPPAAKPGLCNVPTTPQPATPAAEPKRRRGRPPGSRNAATGCRPLYFDIETIPDASRLELFGLPPLPIREAPRECTEPADAILAKSLDEIGRWLKDANPTDDYLDNLAATEARAPKGPRKGLLSTIDGLRSARREIDAAAGERRKLLSIKPQYLRIVSIAMAAGENEVEWLVDGIASRGAEPETEASILTAFWSQVKTCGPVVGFNIIGFDLPAIFIRSALLGIEPTKQFDLAPWKGDCIDLLKIGIQGKMKDLAAAYGIEIPAGDCDGSQVAELYRTDPRKVGEYNASDVIVTREIHKLYQGFFCA